MKRRSPWLTFAACALLNGTMLAEPAPAPVGQPRLALSKAASAAEAELEKRGLAKEHRLTSVSFVAGKDGQPAYYVARVEPPVPSTAENAAQSVLAFQIDMDGRVTTKPVDANRQRVRVIESK